MYSQIASNKMKTWLIMALFLVIIGLLGLLFGNLYSNPSIMYGALIGSVLYALFQYFIASKMALAVNGAKEVTKSDEPTLYRIVENLSITMGMPMPKVYVMEDQALNAFATGRDPNHASVAATRGLLNTLDKKELEAVMAHEMGHVGNFDIRVMMIVFGLVSAVSFVADMLMRSLWFRDEDNSPSNFLTIALSIAAAILAPFAAMLVQMAVSRSREYLADSTSALVTRYPDGLISALEKIRDYGSSMQKQNAATAHLFFANPLSGKSLAKLFSTHPPVEDRIARLKDMGASL